MVGITEKAKCLHLVARSSANVIESCRAYCDEQDEVLFIDDGVMYLVTKHGETGDAGVCNSIYLAADLAARGLMEIAREAGVRIASDRDFVRLLRQHESCLTWK